MSTLTPEQAADIRGRLERLLWLAEHHANQTIAAGRYDPWQRRAVRDALASVRETRAHIDDILSDIEDIVGQKAGVEAIPLFEKKAA